jgi:hypothetical protein
MASPSGFEPLLSRMSCGMSRTQAFHDGNKKGRQLIWRPYD